MYRRPPHPLVPQMEALGKDQARINAMRARNEARRERFLNARQRAIGAVARGDARKLGGRFRRAVET